MINRLHKIGPIYICALVAASVMGSSLIGINIGIAQLSPYRVLALLLSFFILWNGAGRLLKGKTSIQKDQVLLFFLFWFGYALLSFFWVTDKKAWLRAIFFLGVGFSSAIGVRTIVREKTSFVRILNTLVFMSMLVTALGWIELLAAKFVFTTVTIDNIRYYAARKMPILWFGNANSLSFFLVVSLFFLYVKQQTAYRASIRWLLVISSACQIALVLQTRSRASTLGLMTGLTVLIVVHFIFILRREKKWLPELVTLLIVVLLIPVPRMALYKQNYAKSAISQWKTLSDSLGFNWKYAAANIIADNSTLIKSNLSLEKSAARNSNEFIVQESLADMESKAVEAGVTGSDGIRINLIYNGLELLRRTGFIGTGAGNLELNMSKLDLPRETGRILNMHNFWAELLVTYGPIVFLLFFLGFVVFGMRFLLHSFQRKSGRDRALATGVAAGMGSFVLSSISPSTIFNHELFWIWVGIVLVVSRLLDLAKKEEKAPIDKRILFMSALDLWSMAEGQGAPSFHHTVKAYIDDGWDVTLIKPVGGKRKWYQLTGYRRIGFNNTKLERLFKYKKIGGIARILSTYYSTTQFYRLGAQVLDQQAALIYAYEVHAVAAGKALSLQYNLPLVTRFQGTIMVNWRLTLKNRIFRYPHIQALAQRSDMVIMTNDGTFGNRILKEYGNTSPIIKFWRNGVERFEVTGDGAALRATLGIKTDAIVLLTVSRVTGWKRIDRSIRALAAVLSDHPNTMLVVVGDGDALETNKKLAVTLKVQNNTWFVGAVPHRELYAYYDMADIFLSLYDIGNVGNPSMEAMLMGKTILTIDNGDTRSIMGDSERGLMLGSADQETINQGLKTLLEDPELAAKYAVAAKVFADEQFWTWEERMRTEVLAVAGLLQRKGD